MKQHQASEEDRRRMWGEESARALDVWNVAVPCESVVAFEDDVTVTINGRPVEVDPLQDVADLAAFLEAISEL